MHRCSNSSVVSQCHLICTVAILILTFFINISNQTPKSSPSGDDRVPLHDSQTIPNQFLPASVSGPVSDNAGLGRISGAAVSGSRYPRPHTKTPSRSALLSLNPGYSRHWSGRGPSWSGSEYYHTSNDIRRPEVAQARLQAFLSNSKMPNCEELKLLWLAGKLTDSGNEQAQRLVGALRPLLDFVEIPDSEISTASATSTSDKEKSLAATPSVVAIEKSLEPLVYISERLPSQREIALPILEEPDLFQSRRPEAISNSDETTPVSGFRDSTSSSPRVKGHFGAFLDNRLQIEPEVAVRETKKKPSTAGIVGRRKGERVGRLHSAFRSGSSNGLISGFQTGSQSRRGVGSKGGRNEMTMSGLWHSKLSKPTVNLVSDGR